MTIASGMSDLSVTANDRQWPYTGTELQFSFNPFSSVHTLLQPSGFAPSVHTFRLNLQPEFYVDTIGVFPANLKLNSSIGSAFGKRCAHRIGARYEAHDDAR